MHESLGSGFWRVTDPFFFILTVWICTSCSCVVWIFIFFVCNKNPIQVYECVKLGTKPFWSIRTNTYIKTVRTVHILKLFISVHAFPVIPPSLSLIKLVFLLGLLGRGAGSVIGCGDCIKNETSNWSLNKHVTSILVSVFK